MVHFLAIVTGLSVGRTGRLPGVQIVAVWALHGGLTTRCRVAPTLTQTDVRVGEAGRKKEVVEQVG